MQKYHKLNDLKITFDGKEIKPFTQSKIIINIEKYKCYYCKKKYNESLTYNIEYKKINRNICEECLIKILKLKRRKIK